LPRDLVDKLKQGYIHVPSPAKGGGLTVNFQVPTRILPVPFKGSDPVKTERRANDEPPRLSGNGRPVRVVGAPGYQGSETVGRSGNTTPIGTVRDLLAESVPVGEGIFSSSSSSSTPLLIAAAAVGAFFLLT
jgi:hypothetical protein